MLGICQEEGVDDVPDLSQSRWLLASPVEGGSRSSATARPWAIVVIWDFLGGLVKGNVGVGQRGRVQRLWESLSLLIVMESQLKHPGCRFRNNMDRITGEIGMRKFDPGICSLIGRGWLGSGHIDLRKLGAALSCHRAMSLRVR